MRCGIVGNRGLGDSGRASTGETVLLCGGGVVFVLCDDI